MNRSPYGGHPFLQGLWPDLTAWPPPQTAKKQTVRSWPFVLCPGHTCFTRWRQHARMQFVTKDGNSRTSAAPRQTLCTCRPLNGTGAPCVMHSELNWGKVNPQAFHATHTQATRRRSFYVNGGSAEWERDSKKKEPRTAEIDVHYVM